MKLPTTIVIRRLPSNADEAALQSMLLFANDLIGVSYIPQRYTLDSGFQTALAHFKTSDGAEDVKDKLNGKANAINDANLIIELVQETMLGTIGLQNSTLTNKLTQLGLASDLTDNGNRQSLRHNKTFQLSERMFQPDSTPSLSSGKALITDCDEADEMPRLLQESLTFGIRGESVQALSLRRVRNPPISFFPFSVPPLDTESDISGIGSTTFSYESPQRTTSIQSLNISTVSTSPMGMSRGMSNTGRTNSCVHLGQDFPILSPVAVNPADRNPPCDTLYVGNLPIDASEDELMIIFSGQCGYKRLCFRQNHNGSMCFVQFEDVFFATKALNELYGYLLHNSVKGGIRLSFSKNPLGFRTSRNDM